MLKPKLLPNLQPEETVDNTLEPVDLDDFVKKTLKEIDNENLVEETRRFKKWAKNRNFYRGNQYGFWDNNKNTWVNIDLDALTPMEQSIMVINNQFRPQVKTLCKEFSRSQTRIRSTPVSDSQNSILTSRFADALVRYYQNSIFPESLRQLEAKYLLLCGNAFRYTYYDKNKKGATVVVPKTGEGELPALESNMCSECGQEGESDTCENCGGVMERTEIPSVSLDSSVVSYESKNSGELHLEIVDPIEIKVWSGSQSLEQSPYLRRKRLVRKEFLAEAYPHFKPPDDSKMSNAGSNLYQFYDTSNEKAENQTSKLLEYDQIWLEPTFYQNKQLKTSIKLLNGTVISEGTPLKSIFKKGLYVCLSSNTVLGYADECKSDCWVHIPYDNNVDGFWADGLEDAVQNQQIINEYNSLGVENVLYNASPKLIINPRLINPSTVTGRPKDMILMNDNAKSETKANESFAQISGMSLTGEVMQSIENYKRDMREQTGALVAFNGQGDPTITTATGMSIARDSAMALVSTALAVRAEKEIEWCWQILKYVKVNWYDQKYRFLLGKYNEAEANAFKQAPIEEDIFLFVEAGSWMPMTTEEKLRNLGAYLTAFGLPMGFLNPQIPDTVREHASQLYNIPFDFNEVAPDTRIAQKRLNIAKDAFTKLEPLFEKATNPQALKELGDATITTISNLMGVEEDIDDHEVFIREYTKWLKTDEGQNAHPILRQGVKKTIASHNAFLQMQIDAQMEQQARMNPQQGQGQDQKTFQPTDPAENPFNPPKNNEITDFSRNK